MAYRSFVKSNIEACLHFLLCESPFYRSWSSKNKTFFLPLRKESMWAFLTFLLVNTWIVKLLIRFQYYVFIIGVSSHVWLIKDELLEKRECELFRVIEEYVCTYLLLKLGRERIWNSGILKLCYNMLIDCYSNKDVKDQKKAILEVTSKFQEYSLGNNRAWKR